MAQDVELADIEMFGDNTWRIWLKVQDRVYVSIDFERDDPATRRLFEVLTEAANERLRQLGEQGIHIKDFTPEEEE
jgi:hypothetical protein